MSQSVSPDRRLALAEWFGGEDEIPFMCEICGGHPVTGIAGDDETLAACDRCAEYWPDLIPEWRMDLFREWLERPGSGWDQRSSR